MIKGAFYGLIISVVINFALSTSSILFAQPLVSKPFSTTGCDTNFSLAISFNQTANTSKLDNFILGYYFKRLFQLSYLWFSLIAVFNVFLIGMLVSFITGLTKITNLNEDLYYDVFKRFKKSNRVNIFFLSMKF